MFIALQTLHASCFIPSAFPNSAFAFAACLSWYMTMGLQDFFSRRRVIVKKGTVSLPRLQSKLYFQIQHVRTRRRPLRCLFLVETVGECNGPGCAKHFFSSSWRIQWMSGECFCAQQRCFLARQQRRSSSYSKIEHLFPRLDDDCAGICVDALFFVNQFEIDYFMFQRSAPSAASF